MTPTALRALIADLHFRQATHETLLRQANTRTAHHRARLAIIAGEITRAEADLAAAEGAVTR